ncbi:MAG TPA: ATP-binding cassette domain-containing protein, partial [Puia sp.]|nr:ATP-binding cassette domain-containing protein [Puia sp.]
MKEHLLEADSILVELGGRKLLSDIYLQCRTGEVVGLLGRNGTGKSTLLRVLFGVQATPDRSIRIDGQALPAVSLRGKWIAYLPQHSFLPANLSVQRIVHLYVPDAGLAKRVLNNERVRPHLRKRVTALSGGELRYLEILLLLHLPAPFVLLDEPFSGIEPLYQERVAQLIDEYRSRKGFIITDHVFRGVVGVSDRLVLLEEGRAIGLRHKEELETRGYVPRGTFDRAGAVVDAAAEVEFEVDKQTWKDLDLFDQGRRGPVFELFDKVRTTGGGDALERLLKTPSTVRAMLEGRRDSIRFFADNGIDLRIDREQLRAIEHYLSSGIGLFPGLFPDAAFYTLRNQLSQSAQYYTVTHGVRITVSLLRYLFQQAQEWMESGAPDALVGMVLELLELVFDSRVKALLFSSERPLRMMELARCDHFFRGSGKNSLRRILDILYEWDAYFAVAQAAQQYDLCFPHYQDGAGPSVQAQGLFHPLLTNPVTNDYQMGGAANLCFISGANMAGKSTFLKSIGLAVYLSHVGFPVPARSWETAVFNGLITTVNLADNISQGFSHFYTEVRRVKEVVMKIREKKKMVVIFDELFRGTNVKDAADASLQVIDGLSGIGESLFLVSTHIVEIAAGLQHNPKIFFACFESTMEGG